MKKETNGPPKTKTTKRASRAGRTDSPKVYRFLRDNGLSLALGGLFLAFWFAQAYTGWRVHESEQALHAAEIGSFSGYLASGHFWQATAENWESEFLQMAVYVVFTCFLFQRGSAESKDPDKKEPRHAGRSSAGLLYRYSLSIAFFILFALSFALHGVGGLKEHNEELADHGLAPESFSVFFSTPEFWFQSFQNWQSEFLAVLSIVVLSIFLRQDGSPESKPIDAPNDQTGA